MTDALGCAGAASRALWAARPHQKNEGGQVVARDNSMNLEFGPAHNLGKMGKCFESVQKIPQNVQMMFKSTLKIHHTEKHQKQATNKLLIHK